VDFDLASFGVRSGQYSSLRQVFSRRLTDGKIRLRMLYDGSPDGLVRMCGSNWGLSSPAESAVCSKGARSSHSPWVSKLQNWYANDLARRHELLKDSIYALGRLSVATDQF
jgi:hypothetical protein